MRKEEMENTGFKDIYISTKIFFHGSYDMLVHYEIFICQRKRKQL